MRQVFFDAKGMKCPLPVLYARKKLQPLLAGDQLVVTATDTNAPKDFARFSETTGHRLLSCDEENGVFTITLEKGPQ